MSKTYFLFLSFILFLFVVLVAMLSWYSRLATDDYFFIADVRTRGLINGVTSQYMEWCGRYAATFAMDLIFKIADVNQTYYFLIPLSTFLLFTSGILFALDAAIKYYKLIITNYQKRIAAFSLMALIYFLTFDYGESWFWYGCLTSYVWSVIAFLFGIGFLFSERNKIVEYMGLILCFVYIGGASEVYSVVYGMLLTVFIIYKYRKAKNFNTFSGSNFNKKLIFLYSVLAISFIIFLVAPGNYLRDTLFPRHQFFFSFFLVGKTIIKFFILYFPAKIPAILVFAVPFILIGSLAKQQNPDYFTLSFKSFFKRFSLAFASLSLIFYFVVAYVMVESGPPRMMFIFSFLFSIYSCSICFYAGYKGSINSEKMKVLKAASISLGLFMMIYNITSEYLIVTKYSSAFDERVEHITGLNTKLHKDTLIILEPLPPNGMLYSAEIMSDTNHFTNQELRMGYSLKFHVASCPSIKNEDKN